MQGITYMSECTKTTAVLFKSRLSHYFENSSPILKALYKNSANNDTAAYANSSMHFSL